MVQTDREAYEERQKLLEAFQEKRREEFEKMMDQDLLEVQRGQEELFKLTKKAEEEAERAADQYAKTFADRLISAMEGEKLDIQGVFRSLGRLAVASLLEEILRGLIVNPLKKLFVSNALSGGGAGGGGLFGMLKSLLGLSGGEYGRGGYLPGNFVPIAPLRKFAAGGMASGPTLGVIGEEGPEIVARMKPARSGDFSGGDIKQNIYLVDNRPPRIGPKDVVLYIEQDMRMGGKTAGAVENVIKRA